MKRIYVSLDELVDTRLGLISIHKPDIATLLVKEGSDVYFKRMHDKVLWETLGLTKEEYHTLWNNRDVEVLRNSVVTHIPNVINEIIRLYRSSGEHGLDDIQIYLDVNMHPYRLSTEEQTELEAVLFEMIPILEGISFINVPRKELTHSFIKNKYNYVIMYDFNEWMEIHGPSLKNQLINQVQFFAPRIFLEIPDEEEINQDPLIKGLWELDPFKVTESMMSPKLGITFIPASDFGPLLTKPIHPETPIKDLDHVITQSGSYIPNSSQCDPLSEFRQESTVSEESR